MPRDSGRIRRSWRVVGIGPDKCQHARMIPHELDSSQQAGICSLIASVAEPSRNAGTRPELSRHTFGNAKLSSVGGVNARCWSCSLHLLPGVQRKMLTAKTSELDLGRPWIMLGGLWELLLSTVFEPSRHSFEIDLEAGCRCDLGVVLRATSV